MDKSKNDADAHLLALMLHVARAMREAGYDSLFIRVLDEGFVVDTQPNAAARGAA
jgi:hypothetical protein